MGPRLRSGVICLIKIKTDKNIMSLITLKGGEDGRKGTLIKVKCKNIN